MSNELNNFVNFLQNIFGILSLLTAFFPLSTELFEIVSTPYGVEKSTKILTTIACTFVILISFTASQNIMSVNPIIPPRDANNLLILSVFIGLISLFFFTTIYKHTDRQCLMINYILAFTLMTVTFNIPTTILYINDNSSNCEPGLIATYENHIQRIYYCDKKIGNENKWYEILKEEVELKDTDYDISKGEQKKFGYIYRRSINSSAYSIKIKKLKDIRFTEIKFNSEIFVPSANRPHFNDEYSMSLNNFNWISDNTFSIDVKNNYFDTIDRQHSSPDGRLVTVQGQGISCGYILSSKRYVISLDNFSEVIECKPI